MRNTLETSDGGEARLRLALKSCDFVDLSVAGMICGGGKKIKYFKVGWSRGRQELLMFDTFLGRRRPSPGRSIRYSGTPSRDTPFSPYTPANSGPAAHQNRGREGRRRNLNSLTSSCAVFNYIFQNEQNGGNCSNLCLRENLSSLSLK